MLIMIRHFSAISRLLSALTLRFATDTPLMPSRHAIFQIARLLAATRLIISHFFSDYADDAADDADAITLRLSIAAATCRFHIISEYHCH